MSGLRSLLRSAGPLFPALALSGVLGYVVFVGAGRLLAPDRFALFAGYWGLLFGLAGVLAGVEQEAARQGAALRVAGIPPGAAARPLLRASAVITAVLLLVAVPLGAPAVLAGDLRLAGLVVVATVGFALQSVVRGLVLGGGRTGAYAVLVVLEAVARAGVLALLVLVSDPGLLAVAAAVVPGSFAFLLYARVLLPLPGSADVGSAMRNTAGLALAAVATSAVVTGFPALATAFAGEADRASLGALLAAVTLTRLPLVLLGPVQAVLVPTLVQRLAVGGWRDAASLVRLVVVGVSVAGLVSSAGALVFGPALVRAVYGSRYSTSGSALALMTAGAALVAVLVVLASALVALQRHSRVTLAWSVCSAGLVAVLLAPNVDPLDRVVLSLVVGPLLGVAVASAALHRGAGSVSRPSSRAERGG